MKCLTILLFFASLTIALAANNGAIVINVNGKSLTKYILSSDKDKEEGYIHVSNMSVTLQGGGRVYIGNSPSDHFSLDSYYEADLMDKNAKTRRLMYDVDLSQVGCSCNGALYLVSMPAYNAGQQPEPGKDGAFYCDANQVGGTYCPEMDVQESNKYALASTPHTCTYVPPHYYSNCDRGGCGTNVLNVHNGAYGPGKQIDTNKPFTFSVDFITNNGTLTTVTNRLMQNDQTLFFNACRPDYLKWMGYSLPGMVITMSLWGTGPGGMSWLDGKSGCQGGCNIDASKVIFSNIRISNVYG